MKRFLSFIVLLSLTCLCCVSFFACNRSKDDDNKPCSHELVVESYGESQHRYKCLHCDYKTEPVDCSFSGRYNIVDSEKHQKLCECGRVVEEEGHNLTVNYDVSGHWNECLCGYKNQPEAHELVLESYGESQHRYKCLHCDYKTEPVDCSFSGSYNIVDSEKHQKLCECGRVVVEEGHNLTVNFDVSGHWNECLCGYKSQPEAHELVLESYGENQHRYKCLHCDYKTEPVDCSFSGRYNIVDSEKHQKLCECGRVLSEEEHDLKLNDDKQMLECICGYGEEKPCSHELVLESYGESQHRYKCLHCDYKTEPVDCSFSGRYNIVDSEKHQKLCVCGRAVVEEGHNITVNYDVSGHWNECLCGYKSQPEAHELVLESYGENQHRYKCLHCDYTQEPTDCAFCGEYKINDDNITHQKVCECGRVLAEEKHDLKLVHDEGYEHHWYECECGLTTAKIECTCGEKGEVGETPRIRPD